MLVRDRRQDARGAQKRETGTVLQNIGASTDTARDVDELKRIGKFNSARTRPIIVKLTTGQRRQEIMEQTKKLKGTNIWVKKTPRTMEEIRKSVTFIKDARQRGEKIMLGEQVYAAHELERGRPHRESIKQRNTQTPKQTVDMRSSMGDSLQNHLQKITRTTREKTKNRRQHIFKMRTLKQLTHELKKIKYDITALQETKIEDTEISEIDEFLVFNSGGQDKKLEIGFIINKALKNAIIEFTPGKTKNQVEDTGSAEHEGFKDWELERKGIGQEQMEENLNPSHGPSRPLVLYIYNLSSTTEHI
ncbi:hypothetical protein ILUMI_04099 [Ignelater luminosus]|uniref:Endonuclease-reverse transcriptase n=1 Tax=Ignelater luminosus TaxID=2038154 RepID=A0A8K0GJW1_IGNLU|nr:hypothetical protein ILUMI_04099 [Ignelater luminosus]